MSLILHGPVSFEMKIHIIKEDTEQYGSVTYELPMAKYPTPERIAEVVAEVEAQLPDMCPGARLQTREEMLQTILEEKTGQQRGTLAIAGSRGAWDSLDVVDEEEANG